MMRLSSTAAQSAAQLVEAIDRRLQATLTAERLAIQTLALVMDEHHWKEIQVDVEELSTIEAITTDTGQRIEVDDEIHDDDDLYTIIGNCPRRLFHYRDGQFRVTRTEVVTHLQQLQ